MSYGILVNDHLNAFNSFLSYLSYVDIKITEEDNYISLLCHFPYSWDNLVVAIQSNTTTLA
jgi:hypothetical protein